MQQYWDDYQTFRLEYNARLRKVEELVAPFRSETNPKIPKKKADAIRDADTKMAEAKDQHDVSKKRLIYAMRRVDRQKTEAYLRVIRNMCTVLRNQKPKWEIGRAVQQECRDRSRMPSSA
eukprot:TRINITY_DN26100_c0_g1_i3.p1 TRINITY_DN26100_c0_g1~~TRINITY_DN26100_c0_g1_i3.p1  ORF type:complete len:139 (+),score=19.58 TRINITY_DN26100_c0_g1_i3:58-417(+)